MEGRGKYEYERGIRANVGVPSAKAVSLPDAAGRYGQSIPADAQVGESARRYWDSWRSRPEARFWMQEQWSFLTVTTKLHDRFDTNPTAALSAEIRRREKELSRKFEPMLVSEPVERVSAADVEAIMADYRKCMRVPEARSRGAYLTKDTQGQKWLHIDGSSLLFTEQLAEYRDEQEEQ